MKVGDYVRTDNGYVGKIIEIEYITPVNAENRYIYRLDMDTLQWFEESNFIKSSPNIIDLIEVGDYVNGFRVNDSSYGLIIIAPTTDIWEMNSTKDEFKNNNLFVEKIYKLEDIEIKSVITKEQFESMEYKGGD